MSDVNLNHSPHTAFRIITLRVKGFVSFFRFFSFSGIENKDPKKLLISFSLLGRCIFLFCCFGWSESYTFPGKALSRTSLPQVWPQNLHPFSLFRPKETRKQNWMEDLGHKANLASFPESQILTGTARQCELGYDSFLASANPSVGKLEVSNRTRDRLA
ncbi:uncharacterized protein BJX67DRAFT_141257 [Aspergillus lucknowensis]|uniref:Uncharacterized protein n=1 Tax=Aspergillus lucknowensis TaxID=176173 RepID=A0ABR4LPL5_9EURO